MVIGQKRKHSIIKIRLVTLVSKCRRLVYLLFSSNVVQVPHVRSTVISTFPFKKVFPYYYYYVAWTFLSMLPQNV